MPSFVKTLRALAVAAAGLALLPLTAAAQPQQLVPQIAVPDGPGYPPPQPAFSFEGCYQVTQQLYGPYAMGFCLDRRGQGWYAVTGGGLNCNGWIDWTERRGTAQVNLRYSQCGGGIAWTPDRMSCSPLYPTLPPHWPLGSNVAPNYPGGVQPRTAVPQIAVPEIAVPVPQYGGDLRCIYQPSVRGYQAISIIAQREWW